MLLVLFAAGGVAASIYEIVWFQLLQLVIGSTAVSLAILLGTFMGGMCIGSLVLPRMMRRQRHPLHIYAGLEAGIGIVAVLILLLLPYAGGLYTAIGGYGFPSLLLRGLLCGICLLPPTVLMGATLPVLARSVEATPRGVSRVGLLYAANIGGAVFGSLLAGFYLLRLYDLPTATYLAAAINLLIAICAYSLSRIPPHSVLLPHAGTDLPAIVPAPDAAYAVIFI